MLEPRETHLPALLLVLVVLPLVIYIFLGKWSEETKKKERIIFLAQSAAREALRAEAMGAATVIPLVHASKNGIHECARCSGPATTRCSRCKAVRYCSGECQIIHWRQGHKHECQQLETNSRISSPVAAYTSIDTIGVPIMERRSIEKRVSSKSKLRKEDGAVLDSIEGASRKEFKNFDSVLSEEEIPRKNNVNISGGFINGHPSSRSTMHESHDLQSQHVLDSRTNFGISDSLSSTKPETIVCDVERDFMLGKESFLREGINSNNETVESNHSSETTSMKRSIKAKRVSHPPGTKMHKSQKSTMKMSREQPCSEMEKKEQIANESKVAGIRDTIPQQGSNKDASMGLLKMIGLRKSLKLGRQENSEVGERHKKLKMLFPYEEFVKLFQYKVYDLSPRGLMNCGNSCYANSVLQCLTCTRPLTIYLLQRSHSRACCVKDWCLMCELEQHVMMLRECGGPLSLDRILSHIRSINRHIGDGSQEDAHEFLRLLVTSMQSICLGGENVVDPRLHETTFIQHTFGGRLKSKVKCLTCHHESERYENIMDLTLEIFGWVESLEDALTQFTTPEDLDGENMYRCRRCAAYVRAQKQLSIYEAPNILTIVLKRFQEGSYGKINKCITFPDMLDMVPFMSGTDDIPPLYMLYAVVVHLDTLNASFSGHYISYVKDLQGNWFRIDDTEVQPVLMRQVMSEGAYILFYMRSSPRPARSCSGKVTQHEAQRPSRPGQSKSSGHFVGSSELSSNHTYNGVLKSVNRDRPPEFSDATSSDWSSIFTSSDEASFTTESTRDSFSTIDYADSMEAFLFDSNYGVNVK
ncbi:ubiquitin carboxyl-terminal hydrolase 15-like isoform X2 [Camellia sinensis]|uniref:ubiquitin carboxyl-terminal hydrolase 15-like isoform X2 n=1 Tax=Camellia sinensis TaxID=4442 RepID=UPI00103697C4|nr:ubiquitin carboxyl-terminal hydrolase 15-like isoform X2 [Camellia sinensis]